MEDVGKLTGHKQTVNNQKKTNLPTPSPTTPEIMVDHSRTQEPVIRRKEHKIVVVDEQCHGVAKERSRQML